MEFLLFGHLNNYSLHTSLVDPPIQDISKKKTERIAIKDSDWPEIHTTTVAGYIHEPSQFGFDGSDDVHGYFCEVKSSSKVIPYELIDQYQSNLLAKRTKLLDNPIDGRGVFSLFTHEAFSRHIDNEVMMLISAYINGVLMFIIEFPFKHPTFVAHIRARLATALPGGDKPGRSKTVSFAYTSYKDCLAAKLVYLTPEINHKILKGACTKNFYNYLRSLKRK